MTDHAVLAYGDEGDEGFLPLGDQPNQLGFQWATEGFRVDFLNRGAVAWLLGTYFNHVVIILRFVGRLYSSFHECDEVKDMRITCLTANLFTILEQMTKRDQLGNFELMVMLALIRLGDNAYGVPISEELEKRTGRDVAIGSVYAALERLEDKGFVTSQLGEATPERGGRAKRYFRVTARGLREVRETQRALVNLWHGLPELEGGKA